MASQTPPLSSATATATAPQPRLRRHLALLPVTALAFYTAQHNGRIYVLAAEDNVLNVYESRPRDAASAPCCALKVFDAQAIHGIHIGTATTSETNPESVLAPILIWGGQSVTLIPSLMLEDAIANGRMLLDTCLLVETKSPDWIYDGLISPFDPSQGLLVLAHNEVLPVTLAANHSIVLGSIFSISRPILYSANLCWTAPTTVLVAAGTVFGEILVWNYHIADAHSTKPATAELLHVCTGHEGSIFGVQISSEFTGTDPTSRPLRLLASCSDDRTIRVWDISERASSPARTSTASAAEPLSSSNTISALHQPRETGFGDAPGALANEGESPLAMAMGHLSRIWHVKFPSTPLVSSADKFVLPVYSFGEDTTVQLWHFESTWAALLNETSASKPPSTLKHIASYANHDGKHLWSAALLGDSPLPQIATGGADGKISIIEQGNSREADCSGNHMDVMVLQDASPNSGSKDSDGLRQYTFVTDDCLVATTKSGKLTTGTFSQGELDTAAVWVDVATDQDTSDNLRSCTTMTSLGTGHAVLGTSGGHIYVYSLGKGLQKLATLSGKIMQLICLNTGARNSAIQVLVTVFNSPETKILTIDVDAGSIASELILQGIDERFIVTAASFVGDFLVVGSRSGFLSVLCTTNNNNYQYKLVSEIPPRAFDAVACITALPGHKAAESPCFLTTGRDGKYRIYRISAVTGMASLFHEVSLPFGPVVETAWFSSESLDLIICGFRSTRLVVWNESKREQIASVECGGAHRVFAHTASADPNRLRVAFTKASKVYVHSQLKPAFRSLKKGVHGREIRSVAPCGRYLASGSEDTTIRIWEYIGDKTVGRGSMSCVAQLSMHVSGLQSLRWLANEWLFSSSGNEEFFVWRIRKLDAKISGLAAMFQGQLPDKSRDGDLRITDIDVRVISMADVDNPEFRIHMAFSNSELKTYAYSPSSGFRLLASGNFTGACLLQIRGLEKAGAGVGDDVLPPVLTASTDGHLALWEVSRRCDSDVSSGVEKYEMTLATTTHQNSPKAFDINYFETPDGAHGYLVVTGGDDNAIGIVRYVSSTLGSSTAPTPSAAYKVTGKFAIRGAHAAAINGLAIGSRGARPTDDTCSFVSASNDQRVKLWRVRGTQSGEISVEMLQNAYSGVADAGCIQELDEGRGFVVAGVGMEVWTVGDEGE
ncbi:WD repeat-containing protein 6 [Ceratocystis pirilliformis]|uniref:WD repeat-containing protein 6 n=1 Tax=Ceratocystis pirilliformis TaxID=259994 RepID=A0ABR3ZF12_9PEZI